MLQWEAMGYKEFQGVTRCYKGLQVVQGVTGS